MLSGETLLAERAGSAQRILRDYRALCGVLSGRPDDGLLSQVAEYTIILEDRRFFRHPGFDPGSILRALLKRVCGKSGGGASTIEQQFVRTITNRRERTIRRKLREIILAYLISRRFSKTAILDAYLHVAYFGTGLTGHHATSLRFFGRPVEDLRGFDAAFVASLLLYPMPTYPTAIWLRKSKMRACYGFALRRELLNSEPGKLCLAKLSNRFQYWSLRLERILRRMPS